MIEKAAPWKDSDRSATEPTDLVSDCGRAALRWRNTVRILEAGQEDQMIIPGRHPKERPTDGDSVGSYLMYK